MIQMLRLLVILLCIQVTFNWLAPVPLVADDESSENSESKSDEKEDDDSDDEDGDSDDEDDDSDDEDDDSDDEDDDSDDEDDDSDDEDDDSDDEDDDSDDEDDDSDDDGDEEETSFYSADPASGVEGQLKVELELEEDGELKLEIKIRDIPAGSYQLLIGGIDRGFITVRTSGNSTRGEVEFESFPDDSDEQLLDFDPRGQEIRVTQSGITFFTGTIPNVATGRDNYQSEITSDQEDGSIELESYLEGQNASAETGHVKVKFEQESDGELSFEVEAFGLVTGSYELYVATVRRAQFSVTARTDGNTYGGVEFESSPDSSNELLLDFEVGGQLVEIKRDGLVVFSGTVQYLVSNPVNTVPNDLPYTSVSTALLPDGSATVLSNGYKQSSWFGVYDDSAFPFIEHCNLGTIEYRFSGSKNYLVSQTSGVLEIVESTTTPGSYLLFSYETGVTYRIAQTDGTCSVLETGKLQQDNDYVDSILPESTDALGFYNIAFEATQETQKKSVETIQLVQNNQLAAARERLSEVELYRTVAVNNANRTIQAAQRTGVNVEFWTEAAQHLISVADTALIAAQQAVANDS